jgi:hypothetical protein
MESVVGTTPAERLSLAQSAYERFFVQCFWDMRADLQVVEADLPMIAERLRRYGGAEGWRIASRLCP